MARKSKESAPHIPDEALRHVRGVPRTESSLELVGKIDPKDLTSTGDGGFNAIVGSAQSSGLLQFGTNAEAALHAWYQARISPWVTTPAGQAIMNTVANAIARLPVCQKHVKSGKERPLPDFYEMPLTKSNPTFGRTDMLGMTVRNIYRFGNSHSLFTIGQKKKVVCVRPMDSTRLQTRGTFKYPYWRIMKNETWWGGYSQYGTEDDDLPKGDIFPDGRDLPDRAKKSKKPERNFGMLLICVNRTPESNNGVPPGMLNYEGTMAATAAQAYNADFFRDGTFNHMFVTPHHAINNFEQAQATGKQIAESMKANHRATIANLPYEVKPIGFSAKDSQLTEVQEMNLGLIAIAHNMPASLFSLRGSSYAQIYGDSIRLLTDGILPLIVEIENEFSRLLDDNWRFHFDRNALREGDPMTAVKMEIDLFKSGLASMDEARERTGREAYEKPWSEESYIDQNRVPASMIGKKWEATVKKTEQPPPPPAPMPTGRPEEEDGETDVEYPEVPKPEDK